MKVVIAAELDNGYEGVYEIDAPDGTDIQEEIKKIAQTLINIEDLDEEEFLELCELETSELEDYEKEILELIDEASKKGLLFPQLQSWREETYGVSLESVLSLIETIREGWSYSYITDFRYDVRENCFF